MEAEFLPRGPAMLQPVPKQMLVSQCYCIAQGGAEGWVVHRSPILAADEICLISEGMQRLPWC